MLPNPQAILQAQFQNEHGVCDYCELQCCHSEAQYVSRVKSIRLGGLSDGVHPCPQCGGTMWATTKAYIIAQERPIMPDTTRRTTTRVIGAAIGASIMVICVLVYLMI